MPLGWKRRVATTVLGAAAPLCIPLLRRDEIRILNYHRILDRDNDFHLDPDVISASPELFDRQVAFCKKRFDIMSFRDLADVWLGRAALPRRPLIITFDDGYEDNYRHAYATLKRHGLTAMFFLATDYIDTPRLFWWDEVALSLNSYDRDSIELEISGTPFRINLATMPARADASRSLLRRLKSVPNDERLRVIHELKSMAATHIRARELSPQIMTWAAAREMLANGMEIGSHSKSHPVLTQLHDETALRAEIVESKALIEERSSSMVSVFSYPVGGRQAFNDLTRNMVRDAGYRFALTYINGVNRLSPLPDPYTLKRLHVDGLSLAAFRMRLIAPRL